MNLKKELLNNIKTYIDNNYIEEDILLKVDFCRSDIISLDEDECSSDEVDEIFIYECREPLKRLDSKSNLLRKKANVTQGDVEKYLKHLDATWTSEVFWIIDENNYKDSEVYKRACIAKQTFSKFRYDINYQPKRDTAIQMCIGLMLNLDQSIDLLSKAGFSLSNASKRDLVIKYFIENKIYDMDEINYVLYKLGLEEFNLVVNN